MTAFKRTDISRGLGEAIKTLRNAAEMSQQKLAKKLGVELIIIKAMEEGEYKLTLPDLEKLSEVFELRLYQLTALGETYQRVKEVPPFHGK